MLRNKFYIISLIAIILLSGCDIYNKEEKISYSEKEIALRCLYYDKQDFINIGKSFNAEMKTNIIKGGIIPHHLLAKDLIHEFFRTVQSNDYDLIVIIGPDHKSINGKKIFTTKKNWQTPYGILDTDEEITQNLIGKDIVIDDKKMEEEHSVSSIIPFVKYYFPKCNVVSIALSCFLEMRDIDSFSGQLYDQIKNKKVLIIASVDFSHYLTYKQANKKDEITREALLSRDYKKIYSFTNDNMDSPETIISLLKIMNEFGASKETILANQNSYDVLPKDDIETTSYFTVVYYK